MANRLGLSEVVLAAAVADSGTFVMPYPTGTTVADYDSGLAGSAPFIMLNDNDKMVLATDFTISYGATEITITNASGFTWAAGTNVVLNADRQDGNDVMVLQIPINLASIAGAGDVVTEMRPGVYGVIEHVEFLVTVAVTTAAKLASLNLEIGTTNVTGGVIALTSANATPLGKVIAGTAITAANVLTPASKLSVEAASVTAFVEGAGVLNIRIRKTAAQFA